MSRSLLLGSRRRGKAASAVGGGGNAPVIASISRDAVTAAGGSALTITGTGFDGDAAVSIGGASATSVVVLNATTVTCVTPARTAAVAGTSYDVVVTQSGGTSTIPNGLQYRPTRSTTFLQSDFDSALSPMAVSGAVTQSTDFVRPGRTYSAKCSGNYSFVAHSYASQNPAAIETNGLYERFWLLGDTAVLTELSDPSVGSPAQQIKAYLNRADGTQTIPRPGYYMAGMGRAFSETSGVGGFQAARDYGIAGYGHPLVNMQPNTWHEFQFWYKRNATTTDYAFWFDKRLIMQGTDTSDLLGSSDTAAPYQSGFGVRYTERMRITAVLYVDDVTLSNGYIE
jgi:hypothetical protein